jgi:hypothetical protein
MIEYQYPDRKDGTTFASGTSLLTGEPVNFKLEQPVTLRIRGLNEVKTVFYIHPDGKLELSPDLDVSSLEGIPTEYLLMLREAITQTLEKRNLCQQ